VPTTKTEVADQVVGEEGAEERKLQAVRLSLDVTKPYKLRAVPRNSPRGCGWAPPTLQECQNRPLIIASEGERGLRLRTAITKKVEVEIHTIPGDIGP
jgi:hypothetical protein